MTFFITPFHYTDCFSVRQIGYGGNTSQGRKVFIDNIESGIYTGRNVEGEEVILMNENRVGMEIWTKHKEKPNWWEVVSYDEDGFQESVSYKSAREESVD